MRQQDAMQMLYEAEAQSAFARRTEIRCIENAADMRSIGERIGKDHHRDHDRQTIETLKRQRSENGIRITARKQRDVDSEKPEGRKVTHYWAAALCQRLNAG